MTHLRMTVPMVIIIGLIFSSCIRTLYNVENASIPKIGNRTLSLDEVKKVIMKSNGTHYVRYSMKDVEPGIIRCNLDFKNRHQAWVDITYSQESYSIKYVGSHNLRYTPASEENSETIKEHYNTWIRDLNESIQRTLALIKP